MEYYYRGYYESPIGIISLTADKDSLLKAEFAEGREPGQKNSIIQDAVVQLSEYFNCNRKTFDLSIRYEGSSFFMKVLAECMHISYGRTSSYGRLAQNIGKPGGARAVGQALGRNPLVIIVPCHRVTGANNRLTGFSCGIWRKRYLLGLESGSV